MRITEQNKNAALYLRLSREDDEDAKKKGRKNSDDSMSIQTQRTMLHKYADENGFHVVGEYVDDGYSGTNFNRPGFKRMMNDIDAGRVNCVIVKDVSRFGREHVMTSYYLEMEFPEKQVRFISITDGEDSAKGLSEFLPFKSLLHDMYAADISKKIKTSYRTRFEKGETKYITVPFGYKKDPDNKGKLIVDEETAPIVRLIYDLALKGNGKNAIANILTERKVIAPSAYQYIKYGYYANKYNDAPESDYYFWNVETVRGILIDETYIGNVTHYREGNISYKNKKRIRRSEDEYLRIEGAVPAIIEKEDFDRVQELIASRQRSTKYEYRNLFSGMLVCSDCGRTLSGRYMKAKGNSPAWVCFVCPTYARYSRVLHHPSHYIRHDTLEDEVFAKVKAVCQSVAEFEGEYIDALKQKHDTESECAETEAAIKKAERRLKELDALLMQLYEDKIAGKLTARNFDAYSEKYQAEQAELDKKIADLTAALESKEDEADNAKKFIEIVRQYTDPQELTPELLHALIDKIIVGETIKDENGNKTQEIEIVWRFIGKN